MTTFTDHFALSIGRHFITLSCIQHPREREEKRVHVFSGFVVDVAGEWFARWSSLIASTTKRTVCGGSRGYADKRDGGEQRSTHGKGPDDTDGRPRTGSP